MQGLENGHKKLKWHVTIPSPLVTVARKPPTVTTSSFSDLHRWDALVETHDAMFSVENLSGKALRKWMVGRWLFQLIREGALLHKRYLEQVPQAFEQGISFAQAQGFSYYRTAFIQLMWTRKKKKKPTKYLMRIRLPNRSLKLPSKKSCDFTIGDYV